MVKFGEELDGRQRVLVPKLLPAEAFVNYARLRSLAEDEQVQSDQADTQPKSDFFIEWNKELEKCQETISHVMKGKEHCGTPFGPFRISCAANPMSPQLANALFECIELNRRGFQKIVKKYDKNHPAEQKQQGACLKMFDAVFRMTMDDIEMQYSRSHINKSTKLFHGLAIVLATVVITVVLVVTEASNLRVAFVLGLIGAFMTAWGNAANDICNSVGTAVGAKALTLFQAVFLGTLFEIIGCMTLGPFVSKSIVKGIIKADDYEQTPELYAFGMVCVLFGAGSTTLLATFYGFPISATHGIIGGLIAVGIAAKGVDSVGWDRVGITAVGWVAAPLVGALISMFVFALIQQLIYKAAEPARRSRLMQPVFLWMCFAVNILFVLIKGPSFCKVKPVWLAVIIAAGLGIACIPLYYGLAMFFAKIWSSQQGKDDIGSMKAVTTLIRLFGLDDKTEKTDEETSIKKFEFRQEQSMECVIATPVQAWGDPKSDVAKPMKACHDPENDVCGKPVKAWQDSEKDACDEGSDDGGECKKTDEEIEKENTEKYFVPLLIISALSVACAHGGNDVGNAVGPLSAIIMVANSGQVSSKPDIPMWALAYGTVGFILGIVTMGRLTISTVGTKLTALTPSKSFATQIGGAVAVLGSSAAGLPVSTSHCLVGSVVGMGLYEKFTGTGRLNLGMLSRIVMAWGVTIPLAMLVSLSLFLPFKHLFE